MAAKRKPKTRAERIQEHHSMNLFNDRLFEQCYRDDKALAQELLRAILGDPDIHITSVSMQHSLRGTVGRGIRLDMLAIDDRKRHYNVEVQRDPRGAEDARFRLHSGVQDSMEMDENQAAADLPGLCIIFICETDVLGHGWDASISKREWKDIYNEDPKTYPVEDSVIYVSVNSETRSDTPIGKLMRDFAEPDPNRIRNARLRRKLKHIKEDPKGVNDMLMYMEAYDKEIYDTAYEEGREEGWEEGLEEGREEAREEACEEAREEEKLATVTSCLEEGITDHAMIARLARMTVQEVGRAVQSLQPTT